MNLDRAMILADLTNRVLGDRIGKTEHQVWRWRKGKHMPSTETLMLLARELFDGDVTQFYAADDDQPVAA